MARSNKDPRGALAGLLGLAATDSLDEALAVDLLDHPSGAVRRWAVRLLGDRRTIAAPAAAALRVLAARETDLPVLAQLASSAARLPPAQGITLALAVASNPASRTDERVPWLVWWALEPAAITAPEIVVAAFASPEAWADPARHDDCLRFLRRFAAEGSPAGADACAAILAAAPDTERGIALAAVRDGLAERGASPSGVGQGGLYESLAVRTGSPPPRVHPPVVGALAEAIAAAFAARPDDLLPLELAIRAGVPGSGARLVALLQVPADEPSRVAQLRLLREAGIEGTTAAALPFVAAGVPDAVALAALDAIDARGGADELGVLLARYGALSPAARHRARDLFFARPTTALEFLRLVADGTVNATEVPIRQLAALATHGDPAIDGLVRAHWGRVGPGTAEEKLATMRRFANDLRAAPGDAARGQGLFARHCGTCHVLFGEGNRIGPELTGANRQDLDALLGNIVDPSAVIRGDWLASTVVTSGGRVLTGLVAEQDAARITLLDAQNRRVEIPRAEIESLEPSAVSLMPERILEQLSPAELRDLFAYLRR